MRGAHRLRVPVRVRLRPASSPPKARGLLGHRTARGNAMLYVHASSGNKPRQMSGAFHGAGVVPDSPCSPLRAERACPVTTAWHPCSLRGTARCTRYRVGDATGNSSDALRVRYGDGRTASRSCRAHACPHSLIGPAEHAPASCRSARLSLFSFFSLPCGGACGGCTRDATVGAQGGLLCVLSPRCAVPLRAVERRRRRDVDEAGRV